MAGGLFRRMRSRLRLAVTGQILCATVLIGLVCCGLAGCAREPEVVTSGQASKGSAELTGSEQAGGLVLLESSLRAGVVLQSELAGLAEPVRIEPPVRIENRGQEVGRLKVGRLGCTCYGMTYAGRMVKPGESVEIASGKIGEFWFVGTLRDVRDAQTFRASFLIETSGGEREIQAGSELEVVPDFELTPELILVERKQGELKISGAEPHRLTVVRSVRDPKWLEQNPIVVEAPDFVQVGDFQQVENLPEAVESGLHRRTWAASISIKGAGTEGRFPLRLQFGESVASKPAVSHVAEASGEIPLLEAVKNRNVPHEVTGEVALRERVAIVAPHRLDFGSVAVSDQPKVRRFVLTASDQVPFVPGVKELQEGLSVSFDSSDSRGQHWGTVTLEGAALEKSGENLADLVIFTNHPDAAEVRIQLRWISVTPDP